MAMFRISALGCILIIFITGFVYYPKWKQSGTEATISWDVSGYYMYLPALFIYNDIKRCEFKDYMLDTYHPTPDFQQAYLHPSGNYVMKYSMGQAVQYLPAFILSHVATKYFTKYKADGFSRPYQLGISIHAFLIAIAGLLFLGKVLNYFFSPFTSSITILAIVLGSNYLDYAAINGAMTHNGLFTIYAALIWFTIKYYNSPSYRSALAIGMLIGIASLTRPSEIIAILIPLLWGIKSIGFTGIKNRLLFYRNHWQHLVIVISCLMLFGSLQLIYWKYATGEWLVYSYQEQGFSWLRPHIYDGLLSYKSGWLVYSPLFILLLPGFFIIKKSYRTFYLATISFALLFIYIAFAWDIWWYGGSLGQRSMVQSYPVLSLGIAAIIEKTKRNMYILGIILSFIMLCIIYNLWLTHHAHRGGLYHAGQMTKAYFWKTLGKSTKEESYLKLLDTDEEYNRLVVLSDTLYTNKFESDTSLIDFGLQPVDGNGSVFLSESKQFTSEYRFTLSDSKYKWIRASAMIRCIDKEWEVWKMAQFVVKLYSKGENIKDRMIRMHRLLDSNETQELNFDISIPGNADEIGVYFWNANGNKKLIIDNLRMIGIH